MLEKYSVTRQNILLVFWCRLFYFVTLLFIIGSFYVQLFTPLEKSMFLTVTVASLCLFLMQWFLQFRSFFSFQFYIPFLIDIVFIATFVFMTGGVDSPFVFAFGLVIVIAGSQPQTLFILVTALVACMAYVSSAYLYVWQWGGQFFFEDTLTMLLQTSALFLVGGTMASIARRQVRLEKATSVVVNQHRNLQALHSQLIDSMQEGVLVLDKNLRVQDSNKAARYLLARKNIRAFKLTEIVKVPIVLQEFFEKNNAQTFQCKWALSEKNCLLNVVRLPYENEAMWLLTMVDVSEIRQLEKRMAHQDKLATLGRMASTLAHEIRNPLQTISQAADIMQPAQSEQDREMRFIMQEEIERLKRLVSDILGYVQPFQPRDSRVNIAELIASSIQKVDIHQKLGLMSRCKVKEVCLDKDHFRLALDNLLHNAIRFSPDYRSIKITFLSKKDTWFLQVSDKGSGIPDDIQLHLFEPFISQSGIGLGLATVWQVCQANHWQVSFKTSSKGTCFTIEGLLEGSHG